MKKLEAFHMCSLWSIPHIHWQDKVRNFKVLEKAQTTSIEAMIMKAQIQWTGHVIRMDKTRIPQQLLYGELSHRQQGHSHKRHKDCIRANIQYSSTHPKDPENAARDRKKWRACNYCLQQARDAQHWAALLSVPVTQTSNAVDYVCPELACTTICDPTSDEMTSAVSASSSNWWTTNRTAACHCVSCILFLTKMDIEWLRDLNVCCACNLPVNVIEGTTVTAGWGWMYT